MTTEMIEQARAIADELSMDYEVFGVRVQDVPFTMGAMDHASHVWDNGDDTGEELDGVCAQDVKTLNKYHNVYYGDYIAVVAGNDYSYGEDAGELIISDPVVVAILA